MDKRNKLWRRKKQACLFKKRMMRMAAWGSYMLRDDGTLDKYPHWFELAKTHWAKVYKTTGTPCSCWICRGERYNRCEFRKDTQRIIRESYE